MKDDQRLKDAIQRRAERMRKAEQARSNLLTQTVYLGTLGLVFVLPMVAGAFLGHWLDERTPGFGVHWTLSLLVLGLLVGVFGAYRLIKSGE